VQAEAGINGLKPPGHEPCCDPPHTKPEGDSKNQVILGRPLATWKRAQYYLSRWHLTTIVQPALARLRCKEYDHDHH